MEHTTTCAACGEPSRLLCAGCRQSFCLDHLERHFAMGYFYFCAECLAQIAEPVADTARPKRLRKKK
jgi:hypothetical protein